MLVAKACALKTDAGTASPGLEPSSRATKKERKQNNQTMLSKAPACKVPRWVHRPLTGMSVYYLYLFCCWAACASLVRISIQVLDHTQINTQRRSKVQNVNLEQHTKTIGNAHFTDCAMQIEKQNVTNKSITNCQGRRQS